MEYTGQFSIVIETATLSEIEIAEYCHSKGLYMEQIQAWRNACMQANGCVAEQANQLRKKNREKDRQIKKLRQELRCKEAVLAETAALF
ncbi:MAG: IS3 family transposase, partial [Bacillota bacterium]